MATYPPNEPQEDSALNVDVDPAGDVTMPTTGNPVNCKAAMLLAEEE